MISYKILRQEDHKFLQKEDPNFSNYLSIVIVFLSGIWVINMILEYFVLVYFSVCGLICSLNEGEGRETYFSWQ